MFCTSWYFSGHHFYGFLGSIIKRLLEFVTHKFVGIIVFVQNTSAYGIIFARFPNRTEGPHKQRPISLILPIVCALFIPTDNFGAADDAFNVGVKSD
jgi:hypothetical protein